MLTATSPGTRRGEKVRPWELRKALSDKARGQNKVLIQDKPAAPGFGFEVLARDGDTRTGRLLTAHGEVATPAFMPVGTRAAVKAMAPEELWQLGYRMVLANTYHLAM